MSLGKKKIQMQGAVSADGSANFTPKLYTGNGGTQSITGVGFQSDLVWIKSRGTKDHALFDSVRGADKILKSNKTDVEFDGGGTSYLSSFDTDGFTLKNGATNNRTNGSSINYVAWCWKAGGSVSADNNSDGSRDTTVSANSDAGFSIVKLNKPNTNTDTYGHGLSSVPEMIILKRTVSADDWYVYHKDLGNTVRVSLNSSAAKVTGTGVWGSTTPTSSVFTLQNQTGGDHIAYCFHSVTGYQKVGSYSGSSSTVTVTTGFQPRFIMLKRSNGNNDWAMWDTVRSGGASMDDYLIPNESSAEFTNTSLVINATSTGFTIASGLWVGMNESGGEYIYLAIA